VNRAGTQRAVRTTLLYMGAVIVLTGVLTALDLSSAEASRPAVQQGLELFLGIAVVVGRWGRRRAFGPLSELRPQVLKHFAGGVLSSRSVDMVEVSDRAGHRHTYQVESGLFDPEGMSTGTP
jgi:hypothetical protein